MAHSCMIPPPDDSAREKAVRILFDQIAMDGAARGHGFEEGLEGFTAQRDEFLMPAWLRELRARKAEADHGEAVQ